MNSEEAIRQQVLKEVTRERDRYHQALWRIATRSSLNPQYEAREAIGLPHEKY